MAPHSKKSISAKPEKKMKSDKKVKGFRPPRIPLIVNLTDDFLGLDEYGEERQQC